MLQQVLERESEILKRIHEYEAMKTRNLSIQDYTKLKEQESSILNDLLKASAIKKPALHNALNSCRVEMRKYEDAYVEESRKIELCIGKEKKNLIATRFMKTDFLGDARLLQNENALGLFLSDSENANGVPLGMGDLPVITSVRSSDIESIL